MRCIRQHYVPRCYLKWFSLDGRSLHAYDKILSKQYRTSMMSVCYEDNLYTISDAFVFKNNVNASTINRLTIEHDFFSRSIEPNLDILLRQIDEIRQEWSNGKEYYILNSREKLEVALHIVSLYFRHPFVMDSTVDNSVRAEKAGIDMLKMILASQTGDDAFNKLQIGVEYDKPALSASQTFMNEKFLMDFAEVIAKNIFIFWVSEGDDFYTSDFPIVVYPHKENVSSMYMGLAQYGGEVMFTLSPKLALSIYDREFFKHNVNLDGHFIIADEKEIRRHNFSHYFYARRHIFSIKNDFKLVDFVCRYNNGEHVFMRPNHKISIVSGLGKY